MLFKGEMDKVKNKKNRTKTIVRFWYCVGLTEGAQSVGAFRSVFCGRGKLTSPFFFNLETPLRSVGWIVRGERPFACLLLIFLNF